MYGWMIRKRPVNHYCIYCDMLLLPNLLIISCLFLPVVLPQISYLRNPIIGITTDRPCHLRPLGCELHCPFGYRATPSGNCLCICHDDPCSICGHSENCRRNSDGTAFCVAKIGSHFGKSERIGKKRGECPRMIGGTCIQRCSSDSDCGGTMKCCNNGCGRECILALTPLPLLNSLSIYPIQRSGHFGRVGKCPVKSYIQNQNCIQECTHDEDCPWVEKCCESGCAHVCTSPDKATDCVHLVSAISRLPEKTLSNGYVPKCTLDGKFEVIQCDNNYCWCVDEKGNEVVGTRTFKETGLPNCLQRRNCPEKSCLKPCQFGLRTDHRGCPLDSCVCRNICDEVKCINDIEICQLVEPECSQPPCQPVPRCLLNPCPAGLPMTLSNLVTALCTHTSQCSPAYWCHLVGFNGLGFCCPRPEPIIHSGSCIPSILRTNERCESSCRADSDCSPLSKCCFDGCALKCMNVGTRVDWHHKVANIAQEQPTIKGTKLEQIAECPEIPHYYDPEKCIDQCKMDQDCYGMQKCCKYGCSSLCLFPARATGCIHEMITYEIYGYGRTPKCNDQGNYEEIQCEDNICYCVDTISGSEIPGTRVALHKEPICTERQFDCEPFRCPKICPYGFDMTQKGCQSCECRNPCRSIPCPQRYTCVMINVKCLENVYCSDQPRCVPDVCSNDFSPNLAIPPVLCESERDCPKNYWCNNIGIQSKGLCCLMPWRKIHDGPKCRSMEPFIERNEPCEIYCRGDDDCAAETKCCYDGCGTTCVPLAGVSTFPMITTDLATVAEIDILKRIGECPPFKPLTNCGSAVATCRSDDNCPELQKCCVTACGKRCTYPEKSTRCLQRKIAYDKLGLQNMVRCDEDGNFEDIQCDELFCWCVSKMGSELVGTKVPRTTKPNCRARRLCAPSYCLLEASCPYGFETDRNGCTTCRCLNPCKGIVCPSKREVCVPLLVDCTETPCSAIPNCVINACPQGSPILDQATFEPLPCSHSGQCLSFATPSYCHHFHNSGGYCCRGIEPNRNLKTCPAITEFKFANCSIGCTTDEDCLTTDKCCFNGCGLSCLLSERAPLPSQRTKPGECPQITEVNAKCWENETDDCMEDSDCRTVQKCCSNGCKKHCLHPEVTTACFHLLGASESFEAGSFVPQCDASGNFIRVQKLGSTFWCVDQAGREIHGTRTSQPHLNCDMPRSCPLMNCKLDCPLGYQKDQNGCDQCHCYNPCKSVRCPPTHVCRLIDIKCVRGNCDPVPKYEPLTLSNVPHLVLCNTRDNRYCPVGYFCHEIGIPLLQSSYCCIGNEISSTLCATAPEIPFTMSKQCTVQCRTHNDCLPRKCCFNGCGTSCILRDKLDSFHQNTVLIPSEVSKANFQKLGSCPINEISDSKCERDCVEDIDCPGFQKCCTMGCSKRCSFPYPATACIHKLASYNGEDKKVSSDGPRIECYENGTFKNVQCDQQIKHCWCVNTETGEELLGTRKVANGAEPNCQELATACSVVCDQIKCEHGVRLDTKGCPLNGFCECKNPCEEIKCARKEDVCVLTSVTCFTSFCPSVPQCKPNPCVNNLKALRDRNGNVFSCVQNADCGRGLCKFSPSEPTYGICCSSDVEVHKKELLYRKMGECPVIMPPKASSSTKCSAECSNDSTCPGLQLCCEYGCNKICVYPERAPNCILFNAAINKLINSGIIVNLHKSQCNEHTGMFETIQCDQSNSCWCVDTMTGVIVHGSKTKLLHSSMAFAYNVCNNEKSCSISCNHSVCPFGVEMDSDGCPKDNHCKCRNFCDAIQCPNNQICMFRRKTCSESICTPIPSCEVNPCSGISKPAVNETTNIQFFCTRNGAELCPFGHYCTGYDVTMRGVCCPENGTAFTKQNILFCPHGEPFSNKADGQPIKCSETRNDCPSTHHCFVSTNNSLGICCLSKRYVCHLPLDAGPCTVSIKRYYYEYANGTCIPFNYGGCSGNPNNFIGKRDCEKFCVDKNTDLEKNFSFINGKAVESYQLGFSLTGPLLREKHQENINEAFRTYLAKKFSVDDNELRDIVIHDDNTVQFILTSENAKSKAANITNLISDGSFRFTYNGDVYRAEPHSWRSYHIVEKKAVSGMLFLWMLVGVSIVFTIIIVTSLSYVCCFLYRRNKQNGPCLRDIASSYYISRTEYATPTPVASSPNSGSSSEQFEQQATSKNGRHHRYRESDWSEIHTAKQTPGGRRRSRTTVYY